MLKIGNVRTDELVKACGSPLYVYDERKIEEKISDYQTYFKSDLFNTKIIYASKAFTCIALLEKLKQYGCCIDVVSGGELAVAKQAKFCANDIYFHGNNKLDEEVNAALEYGIKTIIIDNMVEVDKVIELACKQKQQVHILIRINPKVEAHTHEFIMTATSDSKFGISMDQKDDIKEMIQKVNKSEYVVFDGFHSHIGSQIFEEHAFIAAIDKMIAFISEMGEPTSVLNIGGGFGVKYTNEDTPIPTKELCMKLIDATKQSLMHHHVKIDTLCMEPGRSIVGEAGYTLYKVGFTKKTENKEFIFIDGGMADNIRPALYDAKYACDIANKMDEPKDYTYEVAGKCCESGDILIHDTKLPKVETNDILVVYTTGAYGYSMASNYNCLNKPAVVFVKDGKARQVIRRETYEDQLALQKVKDICL